MIYYPLILILLFVGPALSSIAIRRSFTMRGHLILLGIIIFYGILPLLLAWGGMGLAERFGCQSETIIFRCPNPSWLGELVTGMVFAHWLAIFTIPSAILGSIGLIISLIVKLNPSRTKVNISDKPTAVFYRSRRHKVISGVCAAMPSAGFANAQRWKLPVQGVRIVTVALAVIIPGLVWLLYLWLWLALPLEPPIESHLVSD
ncbi:PspC domain-containing protein (plasmid) [Nostoc sp. C052]|uniref:PspC domain-containing protein n=1 Tax=Nostoc sp. C052 TaxID=2576902 RepID=UPI0015C3E841|nr:PspC domain-containing protein [Nostoc sp. C052]QLE45382.1 PspC domain-containing protein [Nostoc sp. C052]